MQQYTLEQHFRKRPGDRRNGFGDRCMEYVDFLGCIFHGHPPLCPVEVRVTNATQPFVKGVEDFTRV